MATPEKTIGRETLVIRILWMLLFAAAWYIVVPLLGLLVVAQLLYRLFMGAPSGPFMRFGDSLSQYLAQMGRFAVFNTDQKPWPIADWPTPRPADGEAEHQRKTKTSKAEPEPVVVAEPIAEELSTEVKPEVELAATGAEELSEVSEEVELLKAAETVQATEAQTASVTDKNAPSTSPEESTTESKP